MSKKVFWSQFVPVLIVAFLVNLAFQFTQSTFPVYMIHLGVDLKVVGSYAMIQMLVAILFRPFSGMLVTKYGGLKAVSAGTVMYILVNFLYLLTQGPVLIGVIRAAQGIGLSIVSTGLGALVTQSLSRKQLTQGLGYFGVANSASQTLGTSFGFQLILGSRFQNMFIASLAALLFAAGILVVLYKRNAAETEPQKTAHPEWKPEKTDKLQGNVFMKLYRNPAFYPALLGFGMTLCQSTIVNYLSFLGEAKGLGSVSFFFTINTIGMVASKLLVGRVVAKIGMFRSIVFSGALYALFYFSISFFTGRTAWSVLSILYGLAHGILFTIVNTEAMKDVDDRQRGTANALFYGLLDAGFGLGGLVWGIVANVNIDAVFISASVIMTMVTFLLGLRAQREKAWEPAKDR